MNQKFVMTFLVYLLMQVNTVDAAAQNKYLNGFQKQISGENIEYNSTIAGINKAIFVRALAEFKPIIWETASVPVQTDAENVVFSWFSGFGRQALSGKFHLFVNGSEWFNFIYADGSGWTKLNNNGAKLVFREYSLDQNNDRFGYMQLFLPLKLLEKGKAVELKVAGDPSESVAWFMVFKSLMQQGIECNYVPALVTEQKELKQQFNMVCNYYGPDASGEIWIDGNHIKDVKIGFGYNRYLVSVPPSDIERDINVVLKTPEELFEKTFSLKPVKKWHVNFVQHVHTDIGYTRPQTEILAEHIRFLDYVLDYCDATDSYPENAKFRWTCEASWAVEKFLETRPKQQIDRFINRVKEGRIEVTAMHFNFDELPDEQVLAASLKPLKRIRKNGIPVKTAMQDDVNGIGWCFNDYFNSIGVKYLNMGTHGHRALIAFDKPTAFWWESPAGNRMLAFRAEHYMTGNTIFGIHTGNFEHFEASVMNYLSELEEKNYPFDLIAIQHSGYLTDNSPPSTIACDMIKQWNEKYTFPKLKTATVSEFFETLEKSNTNKLPVYKAAWPDWWTDGFGASAREVMAMREAQTNLISAQGGFFIAALNGADLPEGFNDRIDLANEALLYFGEHTVGSSESVRDPFGKSTMEQRSLKEAYAWEALRRAQIAKEEALGLLQSVIPGDNQVTVNIFNTLSWKRSGLAVVYIDHQILNPEFTFKAADENGNTLSMQPLESRSDGTYWAMWVKDVPALSYKRYYLEVSQQKHQPLYSTKAPQILSNQWYDLKVDNGAATINSIFDKDLKLELTDSNSDWKMGQFIYELLGNRNQMERYTLEDYKRFPFDSVRFAGYQTGPVWQSIRFKGSSAAALGSYNSEMEIRLFNEEKRIDLLYNIIKKPVIEPEGIYIAMPFKLEDGNIFNEEPGGIMKSGYDQIPGSANDWNTVQNFVSIRNEKAEIVITPYEAPLMQFGAINTGRYQAGARPQSTHIFGWPMNNYWTTNFNADQTGYHEWHYSITSHKTSTMDETTKQGWQNRIPFLVRVMPSKKENRDYHEINSVKGIPQNVILVNARPINNSKAILHLRECVGKETSIKPYSDGKNFVIYESNVLAEQGNPVKTIQINPYESKFILISW